MTDGWVDIHCHLVAGVDDGAKSDDESLAMARMAVAEGTATVICTPHQLGGYRTNHGEAIRQRVQALQEQLNANRIPLVVLPGADVRIDDDLPQLLASGEVLSLGDHRKHVLLELPHDVYVPLEPVLQSLDKLGMVGVLSHPERNRGIMQRPELVAPLVDAGCLLQVTTGSLTGSFGPDCQRVGELLVSKGWTHFLATDAHGPKARRPLFRAAFERATELVGEQAAIAMCRENPRQVAVGGRVAQGPLTVAPPRTSWRFWRRAG